MQYDSADTHTSLSSGFCTVRRPVWSIAKSLLEVPERLQEGLPPAAAINVATSVPVEKGWTE